MWEFHTWRHQYIVVLFANPHHTYFCQCLSSMVALCANASYSSILLAKTVYLSLFLLQKMNSRWWRSWGGWGAPGLTLSSVVRVRVWQYWFCEYSRQVQRGVSSGAAVVCGVERGRVRGSRSSYVPQLLVRSGPLLRHFDFRFSTVDFRIFLTLKLIRIETKINEDTRYICSTVVPKRSMVHCSR